MATYGTDLTLISDCYSIPAAPAVVEMEAPYAAGSIGAIDIENFIEGGGCVTQETKNAVDVGASVAVNNGSGITFATDDVLFIWAFFAVGANLYTYANSGHVIIVGSSTTAYDAFAVSGSDRTPNPYGGWYNYAIDPTLTPTTAYGGGSTAHQYFGSGVSLLAKISKGNPHAIDAIRYGRGEIYCTGTDCTFTGMAAENDDNTASQNRWGLFQDVGGSYAWKGLMSFGQSGTSATFSHTGATIAIVDMLHVYSHFNAIEFNHVDTHVTWNNVTFNSLSTVSAGSLEMIDDCSVNITSSSFNNMGWFKLQSKTSILGSNFIQCASILQGGATFEACNFTDASGGVTIYADDLDIIDNCDFTSNGANHAIYLGPDSSGATFSMSGNTFTNYATVNGTTGNEAIKNESGGLIVINYSEGDKPYVYDVGDSSTSVLSSVNLTLIVFDENQLPIEGALAYIDDPGNTAPFIMNTTTNASGIATTSWGGGPVSGAYWRVRLYGYKPFLAISDIGSSDKEIPVTLVKDPQQV